MGLGGGAPAARPRPRILGGCRVGVGSREGTKTEKKMATNRSAATAVRIWLPLLVWARSCGMPIVNHSEGDPLTRDVRTRLPKETCLCRV